MKKKFILFLTVFFLLTNNSFSSTGTGEVRLTNRVIQGYIQYLMMNSIGTDAKNRPAEFKKEFQVFLQLLNQEIITDILIVQEVKVVGLIRH